MSEVYINIMLQSLEKKIEVLERIIKLNQKQRSGLENPDLTTEEFDETVEAKSKAIEQLEQLDTGFEKLFENMKQELNGNKEIYGKQIRTMQEYIKIITDRSVEIQAQESRNKQLMTVKFEQVKNKSKTVRTNSKVAEQYRMNMGRINYIDPQFMDNKN